MTYMEQHAPIWPHIYRGPVVSLTYTVSIFENGEWVTVMQIRVNAGQDPLAVGLLAQAPWWPDKYLQQAA